MFLNIGLVIGVLFLAYICLIYYVGYSKLYLIAQTASIWAKHAAVWYGGILFAGKKG